MSAVYGVVVLVLAVVGSLFMAWTIGAGSSGSTPFAPAVGANAISVMRAGFMVGILGFVGAILQGANVSETIGNGLIRGVTLSPVAVIIGLFTAAAFVTVGIFTGYPIATAFTVTGAVTGVGVALGGVPAWDTYRVIIALWLLIPIVGCTIAYVTARALTARRLPTPFAIAILGVLTVLVVFNMRFSVLGPVGESRSFAMVLRLILPTIGPMTGTIAVSLFVAGLCGIALKRAHGRRGDRTEKSFLVALGGLVAFSAGTAQVGLAIGPLLPVIGEWHIPTIAVLLVGGVGLLVGSWTGAPRMIKALSQDYSALNSKRSIAALVPSFIIAQTAVFLGVPVSFNEIIVSAILGSGLAAGDEPIGLVKMRNTTVTWISSLFLSGLFGFGAVTIVT